MIPFCCCRGPLRELILIVCCSLLDTLSSKLRSSYNVHAWAVQCSRRQRFECSVTSLESRWFMVGPECEPRQASIGGSGGGGRFV